ncbi:MAG: glycosyltransferase [Thiobacillus sp.]|nr:glycosyltransferase [Thiobacillus sp.]
MIDGYNLGLEKGTGVATYARNLSYCLHDLGHEVGVLYGGRSAPGTTDLMKEIAFFDSNAGDIPGWLRNLRAVHETLYAPLGYEATRVPITGTVIADTFKSRLPYFDSIWNAKDLFRRSNNAFKMFSHLGRVYLNYKPDIVHWTYPLPLRIKGAKNIYTLHDLVPLRLPYTTLDNKRRYLRLCSKIAMRADHIVTVSETSRNDIIDLLGVHPDKVTNTYQAVTIPAKYRDKPLEVVRREVEGTFGLVFKGYFLFFGSIEPKKNIGRLIEAYLGSDVETPLVIVGAQAWKSEQELRLLYDDHIRSLIRVGDETRVKRKVIQLDYAPFPLLVSLIRGARATLFPSLYEGFGLPVLESMMLGTPVLSSNRSSIPEVVGEAACLVDPYDTRQMAEAIRALDSNEALRADLSSRGVKQAQLFDEAAYRKRLEDMYSRVIEGT